MKIGIIAAEEEEVATIKRLMQNITNHGIYDLIFFEGEIRKKKCILVKCNVRQGK